MGVKPKKGAAKPEKLSKKAEEANKKAMLLGEGSGRLKVLESLHATGVLTSREDSCDVRIEQVTLSVHGKEFFRDTTLQINFGRRYGLIGANGSGKSTLLAAIACRELPVPDHIDIWHVHQEADPTEISALQSVIDTAAKEVKRLEDLIMKLSEEDPEGNCDMLEALGDKLDKMDPSTFLSEAGALLHGLGFTEAMMHKATKDMSGGWRMRVALAEALFKKPTLLVLDEPTNHLDLGACVWLEEYLAEYPFTIIMTSHSEDFMNTVCTEMMQITQDQRLIYWGGNYDSYIRTRAEIEVNQMKAYEKEQDDIKHLLEFIRSCGTYSNARRQADSKQKIIDKMKEKGLTEKPMPDQKFMFQFPESESLPPPVLAFDEMSFSYSGKKSDYLYAKVNFGIDLDSRVALVGPNGAGKSTLLKLMRGDLEACEGQIKRHSHLRIASYNQHSAEVLPMDKSPLQFMQDTYDPIDEQAGNQRKSIQQWRQILGKYGVNGELQLRQMGTFSDGQKARVVFAMMTMVNPHLLLLDEPTNHLDMACIDALADAISSFTGGTVLVSHDFRLIDKVAKEIWICDGGVKPWKGDIKGYKAHLSKEQKKTAKARRLGMGNCAGANVGGTSSTRVEEVVEEEEEPEPVEEAATPVPAAAPAPAAASEAAPEAAPLPAVEPMEKVMTKAEKAAAEKAEAEAEKVALRERRNAAAAEKKKEKDAPAEKQPVVEEKEIIVADSDWTAEEQQLLEEALAKHAGITDAKEKWKAVAQAVGTRKATACRDRFKLCRDLAKGDAKPDAEDEAPAAKEEEPAPKEEVPAPKEEAPAPKDEPAAAEPKKKEDDGVKKELPPWLQKKARPARPVRTTAPEA